MLHSQGEPQHRVRDVCKQHCHQHCVLGIRAVTRPSEDHRQLKWPEKTRITLREGQLEETGRCAVTLMIAQGHQVTPQANSTSAFSDG